MPAEEERAAMARVLVIDDEESLRSIMRQMLEAGGYEVKVARTGSRTIEDLEAGRYELVVTDLHMPGMDGWAVAKWVGVHRPGIPVIAVGGDSGSRSAMDGFAAVLEKPFRRAALLAAVASVSRS